MDKEPILNTTVGAAVGAMDAVEEFKHIDIENGPVFLRLVAFLAGLGSLGAAIYTMVDTIAHPINYIVYAYLTLFALTTILFETKHEWIEHVSVLDWCQNILVHRCSFLTVMGGRGLFYIFQATLWLTFVNSFDDIVKLAAAGVLGFVGVLHMFAHAGIRPSEIVKKVVGEKKPKKPKQSKKTPVNKKSHKETIEEKMERAAQSALEAAQAAQDAKAAEEEMHEQMYEQVEIEQDPDWLRLVAMLGGVGSLGAAIYTMLDPKGAILHPINFIVYAYLMLFALTTILFETKNEWFSVKNDNFGFVIRNVLMHRCEFLAVVGGRGLFYIFQGTLWLTFVKSFDDTVKLAAAGVVGFIGLLHIFAMAVKRCQGEQEQTGEKKETGPQK